MLSSDDNAVYFPQLDYNVTGKARSPGHWKEGTLSERRLVMRVSTRGRKSKGGRSQGACAQRGPAHPGEPGAPDVTAQTRPLHPPTSGAVHAVFAHSLGSGRRRREDRWRQSPSGSGSPTASGTAPRLADGRALTVDSDPQPISAALDFLKEPARLT